MYTVSENYFGASNMQNNLVAIAILDFPLMLYHTLFLVIFFAHFPILVLSFFSWLLSSYRSFSTLWKVYFTFRYRLWEKSQILLLQKIEQKGMTFDYDFRYSFPLLSSHLKKRGERKGEWSSKNRDQKSCLSARSCKKW